MITAVDSNILIDVLGGDPEFGPASANTLRQCFGEGRVIACEIVWAETATIFSSATSFKAAIRELPIAFLALDEHAAIAAADTWREYRRHGGKQRRILPDFLIAAHAQQQADRLLTRDRGFYRQHFRKVRVIAPSTI